jgi:hypothetical protein
MGLIPTGTIEPETAKVAPVKSRYLMYCGATECWIVPQLPLLQLCDVSQTMSAGDPFDSVKRQCQVVPSTEQAVRTAPKSQSWICWYGIPGMQI